MSAFQFEQIGVIHSAYKEKFAVPRQPGLVTSGGGELHLLAPYNQADAVRGTGGVQPFGWYLSFIRRWKAAGNIRLCAHRASVEMREWAYLRLARPSVQTRSGCRWLAERGLRCHKDRVILKLGSLDLVDGTPVMDIKPYLPFAEAFPDARAPAMRRMRRCGWLPVSFTLRSKKQLLTLEKRYPRNAVYREVLAQDPPQPTVR